MSIQTNEAVLVKQKKYRVQKVSKYPTDDRRKALIGKDVLLLDIVGSTASVRWGDNKHWIPVRSLINVKGFTAKGVQAKNADGFVVYAQNSLKIEVGTAYLNPTNVTGTHAVFEIEGKTIKLPLDILASLVRDKIVVPKEIKKVAKQTGIDPEVINLLDNPELRKDLEEIPSAILKLLPNVNISDIKDTLYNKNEVYSDYLGELHSSLVEVDKANTIIRSKLTEDALLELIKLNLKNEFELIRKDELDTRSK